MKLHFENSEATAMINTGFAVNSKDENTMRIE